MRTALPTHPHLFVVNTSQIPQLRESSRFALMRGTSPANAAARVHEISFRHANDRSRDHILVVITTVVGFHTCIQQHSRTLQRARCRVYAKRLMHCVSTCAKMHRGQSVWPCSSPGTDSSVVVITTITLPPTSPSGVYRRLIFR